MIIPKVLINYLFLVPLFLIGALCVYSDIKYGKIRNTYIKLGLSWIILLYLFLCFYTYFGLFQGGNLKYIGELLINGVIALIVGYALWYFNLWAAGDAKLFTIYAFLIPLEFYSKSYFPYFPTFVILLDTFILILSFLIVKILFFKIKDLTNRIQAYHNPWCKKEFFKKIVFKTSKPKDLFPFITKASKLLLTYFSIFFALQLVRNQFSLLLEKIISEPILILLLFFVIQKYVFRFILKHKFLNLAITVMGSGGAIYLIIFGKIAILLGILKMVLFLMFIMSVLIKFLNSYIESTEIRKIKIKDIKPGLFMVPKEIEKISKMVKSSKMNIELGPISSDGLSDKQVHLVKELFQDSSEDEIVIYKTFPFAPFILSAALISVLTRSSFLPLISKLFSIIR